jgi:type II secretory pathway pseudopilin PulG
MKLWLQKRKGTSGFLLIEVLVAIFILAIAGLGIQRLLLMSFQLSSATQEECRAMEILQEQMDLMRMYSWEQLNDPRFVPNNFKTALFPESGRPEARGKIWVKKPNLQESYRNEILEVEVELSWDSKGIIKVRTARTWITRNGLNSYIQGL